jgi:hypothetical protein
VSVPTVSVPTVTAPTVTVPSLPLEPPALPELPPPSDLDLDLGG